jgi:hypothetical protein
MDDTRENDKHEPSSTMTDNKGDLSTMGDNNATKAEHERGTGRGNGYDECGGDEHLYSAITVSCHVVRMARMAAHFTTVEAWQWQNQMMVIDF